MVRVETGSRLHFGLIRLVADDTSQRRFGGADLMIDSPGVTVVVEPAERWLSEGPLSERALGIAHTVANALGRERECHRVLVERAAPEHAGLGTGTQFALAVACALTRSWRLSLTTADLARLTDRGKRSAVGVHGFAGGGFLVDGGKGEKSILALLLTRLTVPADWRVLLLIPPSAPGLAGSHELDAFARLEHPRPDISDSLSRLLLLGVLPAMVEADFDTFGESIFEFNARSGELFAPVQGGIYASPKVAGIVEWLRKQGVAGAGQSSWGPGVFAFVENEERGTWLMNHAREAFPDARVWLTSARQRGADISEGDES